LDAGTTYEAFPYNTVNSLFHAVWDMPPKVATGPKMRHFQTQTGKRATLLADKCTGNTTIESVVNANKEELHRWYQRFDVMMKQMQTRFLRESAEGNGVLGCLHDRSLHAVWVYGYLWHDNQLHGGPMLTTLDAKQFEVSVWWPADEHVIGYDRDGTDSDESEEDSAEAAMGHMAGDKQVHMSLCPVREAKAMHTQHQSSAVPTAKATHVQHPGAMPASVQESKTTHVQHQSVRAKLACSATPPRCDSEEDVDDHWRPAAQADYARMEALRKGGQAPYKDSYKVPAAPKPAALQKAFRRPDGVRGGC